METELVRAVDVTVDGASKENLHFVNQSAMEVNRHFLENEYGDLINFSM